MYGGISYSEVFPVSSNILLAFTIRLIGLSYFFRACTSVSDLLYDDLALPYLRVGCTGLLSFKSQLIGELLQFALMPGCRCFC
jgi:hypothetical protein